MTELKKHIYRPLKSDRLTQGFGENKACVNNQNKVLTKIGETCPSGYVPLYQKFGLKGHNGRDNYCWRGEPIYFPVALDIGWKVKTEVDNAGGIGVDVISQKEIFISNPNNDIEGLVNNREDGYYGFIKLKFWHLQSVAVHDGQTIKFGDLIGYGDSTGLSSGDHLHWSIKMCDIMGRATNNWNGYTGAFDDTKFYDNQFCLDILNIKYQLTLIQHIMKLLSLLRI